MLKPLFLIMFLVNIFSAGADFYTFKFKTVEGKDFSFESLKGKKVIIVNVASECGYTPQYADLQKLYEKYSDRLVIIGFPSNEFGEQEPGSSETIKEFCTKNYGVTFPIMEKSIVKGEHKNEIYKWLCNKDRNGVGDAEVTWNFNKFLIDEKGNWVKWLPSKIKPFDEQIVKWLEGK